jgi:hypothetical protein
MRLHIRANSGNGTRCPRLGTWRRSGMDPIDIRRYRLGSRSLYTKIKSIQLHTLQVKQM